MLDLPWYGWLNLVGLLILWGLYWVNHNLEKTGQVMRVCNYLTVLLAACFVIAHWNGALAANTGTVVQAFAVFLLAMTAWECGAAVYLMFFQGEGPAVEAAPQPDQVSAPVARDGVLDLDAGTVYSAENQEKMSVAMRRLVSAESSDLDRLRGLGALLTLGDDDEPEDEGNDALYNVIGLAMILAVIAPPCYMAARVLL